MPDDLARELLDDPGRYEIIVAWRPGQGHRIRFLLFVVNNKVLVHHMAHDGSPVVFRRLPNPNSEGKFQVSWALSPEESLDGIVVGWEDLQTPNSRRLLKKSGPIEAGTLFHDSVSVDPAEMPDGDA